MSILSVGCSSWYVLCIRAMWCTYIMNSSWSGQHTTCLVHVHAGYPMVRALYFTLSPLLVFSQTISYVEIAYIYVIY